MTNSEALQILATAKPFIAKLEAANWNLERGEIHLTGQDRAVMDQLGKVLNYKQFSQEELLNLLQQAGIKTNPVILRKLSELASAMNLVNSPEDYESLSQIQKATIQEWIKLAIDPALKISDMTHTSYGIKHDLEKATGIYITNGQMKGALLEAGFKPLEKDLLQINWRFNTQPKCKNLRCRKVHESTYTLDHATPQERLQLLKLITDYRREIENDS